MKKLLYWVLPIIPYVVMAFVLSSDGADEFWGSGYDGLNYDDIFMRGMSLIIAPISFVVWLIFRLGLLLG